MCMVNQVLKRNFRVRKRKQCAMCAHYHRAMIIYRYHYYYYYNVYQHFMAIELFSKVEFCRKTNAASLLFLLERN